MMHAKDRTTMARVLAALAAALLVLTLGMAPAWAQDDENGADPEALCVLNEESDEETAEATETAVAEGEEALDGRLGGSRDAFEDRFGEPTDEDDLFITYETDGCGFFVGYHEDVLTDVQSFSPGFSDGEAEWTIGEARRIANRLLPIDVELDEPYRNVSFVEHQEGFSEALAGGVPEEVYAYVDNNPVPGQCSVVYSLDDGDAVLSFTVQLQIEDPN